MNQNKERPYTAVEKDRDREETERTRGKKSHSFLCFTSMLNVVVEKDSRPRKHVSSCLLLLDTFEVEGEVVN